MRTSLDIPDPLFRAAKQLAVQRETTLKQLVTEGLRRIVEDHQAATAANARPDSGRLPKVTPKGNGSYALSNEAIDAILAEEEAAHYASRR
jgi:hypothetical protein